jgi:hypothetical protein
MTFVDSVHSTFLNITTYLLNTARRRLNEEEEIMSTSDVRNNCVRLYSSTASAVYVMPIPVRVRAAQVTTKQTPTCNGPEVTDTDPGQSKTIPVQNTEHEAVVPLTFEWRTKPEYLLHKNTPGYK